MLAGFTLALAMMALEPPILRRFVVVVIALAVGYWLSAKQWASRSSAVAGVLLFTSACVLYFLTSFKATWDWWL